MKNETVIFLELPRKLKDDAKEVAKKDSRSLNNWLRQLLEREIRKEKKRA